MPVPPQLRCCDASGCRSAGGQALRSALEGARDAAGLTAEALMIKPVGCLRLCGSGPLVACDGPGPCQLFGGVAPEHAGDLIAASLASGGAALAAHRLDLEDPFFALQRPVVLEGCGQVNPESIDDAIAFGTYAQLHRVLQELSPEQVRDEVRRSGLRGRGGAGYPTGLKWDTVALQPPAPATWSATPMRGTRAPSWTAACSKATRTG